MFIKLEEALQLSKIKSRAFFEQVHLTCYVFIMTPFTDVFHDFSKLANNIGDVDNNGFRNSFIDITYYNEEIKF